MIDIHSHILPEIDDGSRSLAESLEMARIAFDDGIEQMVCTPHMYNGLSNNPKPAEIVDRVARLQEAIGLDGLKVLPGNEVHISHEIVLQAGTDQVMKLNRQNYMLVEFPSRFVPMGVEEVFYSLQLQGVRPILVHPERNLQIQGTPAIVANLIQLGVYIQVTAMSVTGEFGGPAKTTADILLRHDCVHFLATDTHRPAKRAPILSAGRDAAAAVIGEEKARRLVYDNPLAVILGCSIDVAPPVSFAGPEKKSFLKRFF